MDRPPRRRRLRLRYVVAAAFVLLAGTAAVLWRLDDDPVTRMPPKSDIAEKVPPEWQQDMEQFYSQDPSDRYNVAFKTGWQKDGRPGPVPLWLVPWLVGLLGDREPVTKLEPSVSLEYLRSLLRQSSDAPEDLCPGLAAASALGSMGAPTVEPLIHVLQESRRPWARHNAAMALGETHDAKAAAPLLAALRDPDWRVRRGAAAGLASWPSSALRYQSPEGAVAALVNAAKDENPRVREAVLHALIENCTRPEAGTFLAALKDKDAGVRTQVAIGLGNSRDRSAVDPLIELLEGKAASVRAQAALSLGCLDDQHAVEPLIRAMSDSDAEVRNCITISLGVLGGPAALESLLKALGDTDPKVQQSIIRALGVFHDARAIGPLIDLLVKKDPMLEYDIRVALTQITGQHIEGGAQAWAAWWEKTKDTWPPAAKTEEGPQK